MIEARDLEGLYGWDLGTMVQQIKEVRKGVCGYCWRPFVEMEHGLQDISLDILNPEDLPYYRTNVRWCCSTCNSAKNRMGPSRWAAKQEMWVLWRKNQERSISDPEALGRLRYPYDSPPSLW
jgi:hypothetical protein